MNVTLPFLGRLLIVAAAALACSFVPSSALAAQPQRLADLLPPREKLVSFEVVHVPEEWETKTRITIEALISPPMGRDYVRVRSDNTVATSALYRGLENTVINPKIACGEPDVRWAIVLNYQSGTREVLGFNRFSDCLQVQSKGSFAVSRGMRDFVARTFAFML